jgi:hypothetical protein
LSLVLNQLRYLLSSFTTPPNAPGRGSGIVCPGWENKPPAPEGNLPANVTALFKRHYRMINTNNFTFLMGVMNISYF